MKKGLSYDTKVGPHAALGLATLTLVAAAFVLALSAGNIGFQGDDWWVLSFPFWNPFPHSVWEYALASRRPMEGLYWIVLFEIFGFQRVPYLIASILLQALSSVLMGMCISRMCPQRRDIAVWAAFFSFVMPMTSNLFYVLHTDNSRLSMVFFWASALFMQHSVSGGWWYSALAVGLYWLSVLSYENASLLIFSIPFFAAPELVEVRKQRPISGASLRLACALIIGFLGFLGLRFLILSGGAVSHAHMMPSLHEVFQYCCILVSFLIVPFTESSSDIVSWCFGIAMALAILALMKWSSKHSNASEDLSYTNLFQTRSFVTLTGVAVFLLGATPYLLAGYSSVLGFTSQSRVYSSSSCGIALLFGLLFSTNSASGILRHIPKAAGVALVSLMAVFMCDLRKNWQEAAKIRADLCRSLTRQVPQVMDFSTLLFLDLQSYLGNRAVIFQGVDGLNEYVKMLYRNKTLQAYFLYSTAGPDACSSERTAVISPKGVAARGSAPWGSSPLNSIILFKRQGPRLLIVDSISQDEGLLDAEWLGITKIVSCRERILPPEQTSRSSAFCLY